MTDIQEWLGKKLDMTVEHRDCAHVAVIPVVLDDPREYSGWRPGIWAVLNHGTADRVRVAEYNNNPVGVIDPFLPQTGALKNGDRVLLWLWPNTVVGMRHHWRHPAFDNPLPSTTEAEVWLRRFAEKWNFDYSNMISSAARSGNDRWVTAMGHDLHGQNDLSHGELERFWECMEELTGRSFSEEHRNEFGWCCSC